MATLAPAILNYFFAAAGLRRFQRSGILMLLFIATFGSAKETS
jgi:hypothetical protein